MLLRLLIAKGHVGDQGFSPEGDAENPAKRHVQEHHPGAEAEGIADPPDNQRHDSSPHNPDTEYAREWPMIFGH